jgi:membrane associated rhomboid family serine protease
MLATPELNFRRAPVTLILAAVAVALEAVCFLDPERREFYYNDFKLGIWHQVWQGEPWRPFTTTLLHGGFLHALFNVYWLCTFGPAIESWWGSFRALGLIVLLAYVSSLAQYVFANYFVGVHEVSPSVGLSGVVYGLFGVVWIASRYRVEARAICSRETVQLMVVWFFLCIVATRLGWMRVANVAHGAGLALGLLIGVAVFQTRRRWIWTTLAVVFSLITLATLIAAPGHPHYDWVKEHRARTAPP